jgi:hypothetical protein
MKYVLFLALASCFYWGTWPTGFCGDHHIYCLVSQEVLHCWGQGTFWAPLAQELNGGLGSYWPRFYPPLFHYLCALGLWSGLSYWVAAGAALGLGHTSGCWLCYCWLRNHFDARCATCGALAYALSPYFALNLVHRGAFPEALAWEWLPGVLWALDRLRLNDGRWIPGALGMFFFALIALSNFPALVICSYGLVAYTVVSATCNLRVKRLLHGFIIFFGGLSLSAFFWLPAWLEKSYVVTPTSQLADSRLLNSFWSINHPSATYMLQSVLDLNISGLLVLWEAVGLIAILAHHRAKPLPVFLSGWCLMGFGLWLCTEWSAWFFRIGPLLGQIQFPWRGLGLTGPGWALMGAYMARGLKPTSWCFVVCAIGWIAFLAWQSKAAERIDSDWQDEARKAIGDYVPRDCSRLIPPAEIRPVEVMEGEVAWQVMNWKPRIRAIRTDSRSSFRLAVRTYAYHRWRAFDQDDRPLALSREDTWGRPVVDAPTATTRVEIRLSTLWSDWVGVGISVATVVVLIGCWGYSQKMAGHVN